MVGTWNENGQLSDIINTPDLNFWCKLLTPLSDQNQTQKTEKREKRSSISLSLKLSVKVLIMNLMRSWKGRKSDVAQKVQILKDKWDWLCARECDVRTELDNAEIQPRKKRRREVDVWLRHVELTKIEVESISNEVEQHRLFFGGSELNGRIERVTKDIEDQLRHGSFLNGLVLDDYNDKCLPLVVTDFVGDMFKINIDRILLWLRNSEAFVIGVYGMGGVGKTTLLMHLHNQLLSDSRICRHVYWVTVSLECSVYRLQHKIAEVLGVDLSVEEDEKKRAAVLHGRLVILGPTVFLLDDMWKHFSIEEIGIPLGANSCKIVITTRSREVCRRMGCQESVIKVETLGESEAQKLFIERFENHEALSTEVKKLADLVVKECGGLPLAIITTACSMRGVFDVHEWHSALVELSKPSGIQDGTENNVLLKLKVSYDRLNDRRLQLCFLSCILYPEDYPIWRERLIELWIMEGLLDDIENKQEQVNKGHTIINRLENSCLLQAVSVDCSVKMHDLIRDMAILITQNYPRFLIKAGLDIEEVPREELWIEDLVKVSLMGNKIKEIPCQMSPICPKLSVLLLQKNPLEKIPESFFAHMTSLTVLDLSSTRLERLPNSLSNLESLRLLLLRFCADLVYVPSLVKLMTLKVLNLHGTNIEEAPVGMESLRHLEEVSCGWKMSYVSAFNRYINSEQFRQLHYYGFWLHGQGGDCEGPCRLSNKEVVISGVPFIEGPPAPLLPYDMQLLEINNCDFEVDKILGDAFPSLYRSTELKNLDISECKGMEYISSYKQKVSSSIFTPFQTVEYIQLFGLFDFIGIIKLGGEMPPCGTFSHLKTFIIEACPRIRKLFPLYMMEESQSLLPYLEHVQVCGCEEMEEIFAAIGDCSVSDVVEDINPLRPVLIFPRLKVLKLQDLPKLRCIYRGLLFCTSLQNFCTDDCPNLELLPLSGPFVCDSVHSFSLLINNSQWWQWLWQHHSSDARLLLSYIEKPHT